MDYKKVLGRLDLLVMLMFVVPLVVLCIHAVGFPLQFEAMVDQVDAEVPGSYGLALGYLIPTAFLFILLQIFIGYDIARTYEELRVSERAAEKDLEIIRLENELKEARQALTERK
jgi:hypothetical protein